MKLIDALKDVVRTKENSTTIGIEELSSAINLNSYPFDYDKFESKLICYWVFTWYCTDTWVGLTAIYLGDELMGYTYQSARKNPLDIYFLSNESAIKVKDWYKECLTEEAEPEYPLAPEGDLEEEIPAMRNVHYSDQLLKHLDKKGFHNGERVTPIKPARLDKYVDKHYIVRVDATGEEKTIPVAEYKFPIHVNSLILKD